MGFHDTGTLIPKSESTPFPCRETRPDDRGRGSRVPLYHRTPGRRGTIPGPARIHRWAVTGSSMQQTRACSKAPGGLIKGGGVQRVMFSFSRRRCVCTVTVDTRWSLIWATCSYVIPSQKQARLIAVRRSAERQAACGSLSPLRRQGSVRVVLQIGLPRSGSNLGAQMAGPLGV